jgi:signal recognition particle receptor subunit beta
MVQFNFAERTIKAKVVYYGPPQSGKTTNLEQIHRLTDPTGISRLVSLNTGQDRTLFFDLLPFSLGSVAGYDFKLQLYTVPGQVQYNATRRVVLSGADAVVFVADSRKAALKDNAASFENMKVNLLANRLVPEKVPLVMQYNKRDLPDLLSLEELDAALNAWHRPTFAAMAASGEGVMDAFMAVVQHMLTSIAIKYSLREKGLDPADVPAVVGEAFDNVMRAAAEAAGSAGGTTVAARPAPPARLVVTAPPDLPTPPEGSSQVPEELLHRAIHSNVELAEALSGMVREMNLGLAAILSHAELLNVYREGAREKRDVATQSIQKEALRLRAIVQQLGRAGGASPAPSTPTPAPTPSPLPPTATQPALTRPPVAPPSPPRPAAASVPAPAPSAEASSAASSPVDQLLRSVLDRVSPDGGLAVEIKVSPGLAAPACPPELLEHALSDLLAGAAGSAPPRTAFSVQAERKAVVLRSRSGEERRDFVLLAVRQAGGPSADEQTRIAAGDPGLFGGSPRRVRELGGFIRFAPSAGGVEMRVFLPAG